MDICTYKNSYKLNQNIFKVFLNHSLYLSSYIILINLVNNFY